MNDLQAYIDSLPVPQHLAEELAKVNWESIRTPYSGSGQKLPAAINGVLSGDQTILDKCLGIIWYEIEHQGSVYEATYQVAIILSRLLPYYENNAPVQQQAFNLLSQIFELSYFSRSNRELFFEVLEVLQLQMPFLLQKANDGDTDTALKARYILIYVGQTATPTVELFQQALYNTASEPYVRAHAAFCLGGVYLLTQQIDDLLAEFTTALAKEQHPLLRFVISIQLITADPGAATEEWIAELITALRVADTLDSAFAKLTSFNFEYDVQEFVLQMLRFASPETLLNNIEPVIEILPAANALKQITLLNAVFFALFPEKEVPEHLTPVQQKALLAAAKVVELHINFVNHMEVFQYHNIPYNAIALRLLAAKPGNRQTEK